MANMRVFRVHQYVCRPQKKTKDQARDVEQGHPVARQKGYPARKVGHSDKIQGFQPENFSITFGMILNEKIDAAAENMAASIMEDKKT